MSKLYNSVDAMSMLTLEMFDPRRAHGRGPKLWVPLRDGFTWGEHTCPCCLESANCSCEPFDMFAALGGKL